MMINVEITQWSKIKEHYKGTLVLGNGSSQAIDENFRYKELYKHSVVKGWITDEIKTIFEHLETEDFERILKGLYDASRVVDSLNQADAKKEIDNAYNIVRNSLIQAVRSIHQNYLNVVGDINTIANFIPRFKNIVSLNYDLVLYWALMKAKESERFHTFKDAFIKGVLHDDPSSLYEPCSYDPKDSTLVWYPHGTFFLNASLNGEFESKTNRVEASNLLGAVFK